MATTYEAFSKRQKMYIVAAAIVAVIATQAFAAWVMSDAMRHLPFSTQDQDIVKGLSADISDPLHRSILRAHAIDAVSNLKLVANKQSIIVVALAGSFALAAVGFSLFLLGADGAFQVQADHAGSGAKLLFVGTAPGLLCFALAVVLMGMGIRQPSTLNLGSVSFPAPAGSPAVDRDSAVTCSHGECVSDSALDKLGVPGRKEEK